MILPARPAHFLLGRLVVSQVLQYNHLGTMPLREFVTPCILFLLPEIVGAVRPYQRRILEALDIPIDHGFVWDASG